ncbi:hypothetical protein [Stenotrophomonas koreensis]|uniref:hypothetical protein n=1 Tax=Stenotrophomonas koreensis TaxID=266128 RepID=UPI00128FB894|nr:hypothetical protein [Stenotrophomonas koreensis]
MDWLNLGYGVLLGQGAAWTLPPNSLVLDMRTHGHYVALGPVIRPVASVLVRVTHLMCFYLTFQWPGRLLCRWLEL